MATTTIHQNDAGVLFLVTISDESGVVDLTTAQTITISFQKPDRSIITKDCTTVNATAGLVSYTSVASDFDQVGNWKVQVLVRFADTNVKHSDVGTLKVAANLPI